MMMTVSDINELRRQGRLEEAYEAVRQLYAVDKGTAVAQAMFWTAVDVFGKRLDTGKMGEAARILMALERMQCRVPCEDRSVAHALETCRRQLETPDERREEPSHLQMGEWGEQLAMAYLRDKGYIILAHDWHSGHRDLDIVARQGSVTVFVEVKTRRNQNYMDPVMAVDYHKQRHLLMAINHFIKRYRIDGDIRFDVITVTGCPDEGCQEIEHIEDFQLSV